MKAGAGPMRRRVAGDPATVLEATVVPETFRNIKFHPTMKDRVVLE